MTLSDNAIREDWRGAGSVVGVNEDDRSEERGIGSRRLG